MQEIDSTTGKKPSRIKRGVAAAAIVVVSALVIVPEHAPEGVAVAAALVVEAAIPIVETDAIQDAAAAV